MHISLIPFIGILVLFALAIRRFNTRRSRGRSRKASSWTYSFKLLPVPEWSIQTDDADLIAWISNNLVANQASANRSLPLTRPGSRSAEGKSRTAATGNQLRKISYDYVSPALALVGSVLAVGLLLYQAGWTLSAIAARGQALNGDTRVAAGTRMSSKRSLGIVEVEATTGEAGFPAQESGLLADQGSVLQPLIPGITIPLSHTVPLLLALFASQVIHELGHLVVAALHDISTSRLVAGMYMIFPFAAVVLPTTISDAQPKTLLRVAAAGPFHNALTWLVILALPLLRLGSLFYADVSGQGVYVVHVHKQSPLKGHLPEHSVIVQLDNVPLAKAQHVGSIPDEGVVGDIWTAYLFPDGNSGAELERWNQGRGWCVNKSIARDSPSPPCPPSTGIRFEPVPRTLGIANSSHPVARHHCFAAYPLLAEPTVDCSTECKGDATLPRSCIRPIDAESILRMHIVSPEPRDGSQKRIVLFTGERAAVYRDVTVSALRPRGGMAGRVIMHSVELVLLYIATLSLALATLNLLPLPRLDGTHILSATLGLLIVASSNAGEGLDVEDEGETGMGSSVTRRTEARRRWWHRVVSGTAMFLTAVCVGGGAILQALS